MLILVSDKMFDTVMARAQEIAAEQFRRMVFDTNMRPEAAELVREQVIDAVAERIVDGWADKAAGRRNAGTSQGRK